MRIQHNIMAMSAYRNYTNNVAAMKQNLEKLSSGYKINRAGDDAAGLAISEKMRAQITGLETAQKNAKDGISLVQTAEGALTEVHDMLNRMVELASMSANGTYDNTTDRAQLQKELNQLRDEINRIADSSNFNGIKLLDGTMASGTTAGAEGTFDIPDVGKTLGVDTILHKEPVAATKVSFGVDLGDAKFKIADGAELTINVGDTAIKVAATAGATDDELNAGDIAAIVAGTSTKTGYTVTAGTDTTAITDGKFTIGGEEFQASVDTDGIIKFTAVNDDVAVDPKMSVSLSGNKVTGLKEKTEIATATPTKTVTGGTSGGTVAAAASVSTAGSGGAKEIWEAAVSGLLPDGATKAAAAYKLEVTVGSGNNAVTKTVNVAASATASTILSAIKDALDGQIVDNTGTDTNKFVVTNTGGTKLTFTAAASGSSEGTFNPTNITIKKLDVQTIDFATAKYDEIKTAAGDASKVVVDIGGQSYEVDLTTASNATKFAAALATAMGNDKITSADTGDYAASAAAGVLTLTSAKGATMDLSMKVSTVATSTEQKDVLESTHYNVNTIVPDEGEAAQGGLASTVIKIDKSMTTNGSVITIGYKDYTFTDDVTEKDTAGKVYIGDLDSSAKDYLAKVGERLALAANDNKVWTVGKATSDGTITLAEKTKADGTAKNKTGDTVDGEKLDLTTKEGIAATLGYKSAGREGRGLTLQIGDTADDYNKLTVNIQDMHCASLGLDKISIEDQDSAAEAIDVIKAAINKVSDVRGTLGATQNRLDHTINNLSVMTENIQDAESTIRDVDIAEEMMAYTKNNILIQSAQAMLAQANQVPQGVLQLLQ